MDEFLLTLLLPLRALSALVTFVLVERLSYMEYAILPENPWQLPMIGNRSPLDGMGMRGEDCQLEELGEFSGKDSQTPETCS